MLQHTLIKSIFHVRFVLRVIEIKSRFSQEVSWLVTKNGCHSVLIKDKPELMTSIHTHSFFQI